MGKLPITISTTYRAHPSRVKLGEFLRPTPRQRFKRAVRELEEARAKDRAWDLIGYLVAIALVVGMAVTFLP